MKKINYKTRGVCSKEIDLSVDGDTIADVEFHGGCDGNLKAISKLVKGKPVDEIIEVLEGNTCGSRKTSCADQLAKALREVKAQA